MVFKSTNENIFKTKEVFCKLITIIDYGMGNIGSLENMIKKVGSESQISTNIEDIKNAHKLILPGVGCFDNAIRRLNETGIINVLNEKVLQDKVPILCICLGAQLVTQSSEEGDESGLGWVKARTVKFPVDSDSNLKIPHMGWNNVIVKKESRLFKNMYAEPSFYFVHSYHFICDDPSDILTTSIYGYEFASAIEHKNIYATQFHPEKSHKYGIMLMKNFVEL